MSDPKVIDPPAEIWLCYGDLDGEDQPHSAYATSEAVLWCEEQIDNSDVRYVLATDHDALRARVNALEDALRECAADAEVMDMPGGEWCMGIDGDKWAALVSLLEPTP